VVSSTSWPHFTPGKDSIPILQEAGWALGPVWTGGKSRPHRDSIPDRPARSSVAIPTELHADMYNTYNTINIVLLLLLLLLLLLFRFFLYVSVPHSSLSQSTRLLSLIYTSPVLSCQVLGGGCVSCRCFLPLWEGQTVRRH